MIFSPVISQKKAIKLTPKLVWGLTKKKFTWNSYRVKKKSDSLSLSKMDDLSDLFAVISMPYTFY